MRSRVKGRLGRILIAAGVVLVGGEIICRVALGLGDPPLFVRDDRIEYLPKPGVYARFGHRVSFNELHMRTPSAGGWGEAERRVLVLGDSVPNGGAKLDDSEVGTAVMQERLGAGWRVMNASCGSWGPENLLEYVRRFGTLEAEVAVVVLNNADAWDVPTFGPLGSELPTRRPILAMFEAVTRYLPRILPGRAAAEPDPSAAEVERSLASLRDLIALLRSNGVGVALVLHAEKAEPAGGPGAGTVLLRRLGEELAVPTLETGPAMSSAGVERVYDGRVHLTAEGQRVLAGVMLEAVERALGGVR